MQATSGKHIIRSFLMAATLCVGLAATPAVFAEPSEFMPSKIYATAWGLTLAADGTGFYNDLGRYVIDGLPIGYDIEPYRRAMRRFFDDTSSCVFPKSVAGLIRTREVNNAAGFIQSLEIQKTFVAVFSAMGQSTIGGPADLAGKRVAYAMGSKVPEFLGAEGAFFIAVADEVDKARMLITGRVDVMVGNLPDAGIVYQHLGSDLPPYDPAYAPFATASSRIVCHDTPGNRAFMDMLNQRLRTLRTSGALADFYRRYGLDPALYLSP